MNTPDDPRPTDHALPDDYSDVRRAYAELGDEPVPPSLDANVLQHARAAVRPTRARPRWIVPVSLAASVVLAVGVAFDLRRESRHEIANGIASEAASMDASGNASVVRDTASDETAAVREFAVPAEHGAPSLPREAADTAADAAPASASPAAERATPARGESAAGRRTVEQPHAMEHERAAAPRTAATPPPPDAARRAPVEGAGLAAAPSPLPPLAPEDWLAKIEALRREGRSAEAEAEFARFVATYPDHPRANPPR